MAAGPASAPRPRGVAGLRVPLSLSALRRLLVETVDICLRYRVTGLAAEGAFFAVLSLPPLIFGLAGTVGYVTPWLGDATVAQIQEQVVDLSGRVLTGDIVTEIISPTLADVLEGGRADVISLGFILALWSGSRALNVFVDTISIMYGYGGHRGIVRTRALSFALYLVALVIGIVLLPLVLAGPAFVSTGLGQLPEPALSLRGLYWPVVIAASTLVLAALYHVALPVRTSWRSALPGALVCLALWVGGAVLLRRLLEAASGSTSIYGPLAAPIAVLVWLYLIAIAVLIGAAVNAAWARLWSASELGPAAGPGRDEPPARENPVPGTGAGG